MIKALSFLLVLLAAITLRAQVVIPWADIETPAAIVGTNSITAAAGQNLVFTAGSNGASLTLGQGANGAATLNRKLTFGADTSGFDDDATLSSFSTSNGVYLNGHAAGWLQLAGDGTRVTTIRLNGPSASSNANGIELTAGGSEAVRITSTRNLLIGGTTDITGSGGLKVFGTTAATSPTSGCAQFAGGVGVAGAGYFSGQVSSNNGTVNARLLGTGTTGFVGTSTAHDLVIQTSGSERARFSGSSDAVTFAGSLTIGGHVEPGAGTDGQGRILNTAAGGLIVRAKTGSSYDLSIRNAAGSDILRNPTGTSNLEALGNLTVSGTTNTFSGANGSVRIGASGFSSNLVSLNNDAGATTTIGIWGGGSGDSSLHYAVPSGGTHDWRVNNTTQLTVSGTTTTVGGNLTVGAGSNVAFTGRSALSSPSDGVLLVANSAGTDFARIQFGGTSNLFPAMKRSAQALQVRLADDSGPARLDTGDLNINSTSVVKGIRTATASLDFPNIAAGGASNLTVTVTGAAVGDQVIVHESGVSFIGELIFKGIVNAANTVTIKACNYTTGAIDAAATDFRVTVISF